MSESQYPELIDLRNDNDEYVVVDLKGVRLGNSVDPVTTRSFKVNSTYTLNNVLSFDGNNDDVDCGDNVNLWSRDLAAFTAAIRVKDTGNFDINYRTFIGLTDDPSETDELSVYFIKANADSPNYNAIGWDLTSDGYTTQIARFSNSVKLTNVEYLVMVTFDNTGSGVDVGHLYIDGVVQDNANDYTVGNLNGQLINIDDITHMMVGNYVASQPGGFKGTAREFMWWPDIAFSATQAQNLADGIIPIQPSFWLKMNEGAGEPADTIDPNRVATRRNGTAWLSVPGDQYFIRVELEAESFDIRVSKDDYDMIVALM